MKEEFIPATLAEISLIDWGDISSCLRGYRSPISGIGDIVVRLCLGESMADLVISALTWVDVVTDEEIAFPSSRTIRLGSYFRMTSSINSPNLVIF